MAKEGTQIIMFNPSRRAVVMYLRDDFPHIPFPNRWALPGGMLEAGESTAECVLREIKEEMGLVLDPNQVEHFATRDCDFGIEHTFWTTVPDLDIDAVHLTEGQALAWFTAPDVAQTELAYADNEILAQFFATLPAVEDAAGGH
ncbi:NUDIX hydrolase [Nocardia xishanensis]|uniref:NUDIX hydrolase n=1 Tax=Nocardia xishanensis TaxID=238964 RepID=UPI00082FFF5F|nr:NUDIX domain-containing protein [Nocardia xishanensis]